MGNDGSSKVTVEEQPPKVRGIPSAPTSVFGAVGITERGPIGVPTLCSSPDEFEAKFGGFIREGDLPLAAAGFYENGGTDLWVVRTVHHRDTSDPGSATARRASGDLLGPGGSGPAVVRGSPLPLALEDGDALVFSVTGGPDQAVLFSGAAASVPAGGPGPYTLTDGDELTLRVDRGREQTLVFEAGDFGDIGNATPEEVAAVVNGQIRGGRAMVDAGVPELASDTEGRGSSIEVTGGNANAALGFPSSEAPGLGDVADLAGVTLEEVQARVAAEASGVEVGVGPAGELELRTSDRGASATLQVRAASAEAFGFDADLHRGSDTAAVPVLRVEGKDPGRYAERLDVVTRPSPGGDPSLFDLVVVEEGSVQELFAAASVVEGNPRHVEHVVNDERLGSRLIRVTDLRVAGSPAPAPQTLRMAGGDDGLVGLDDNDFIGSEAGKTGLYALDTVQDLAVLMVPGRATPSVHQAMVRYCEVHREGYVFPVLDPPLGMSATEIVAYVERTAGLLELSEYGAIYWPRVRIRNRNRTALGSERELVVADSPHWQPTPSYHNHPFCEIVGRRDGLREPPLHLRAGPRRAPRPGGRLLVLAPGAHLRRRPARDARSGPRPAALPEPRVGAPPPRRPLTRGQPGHCTRPRARR